MNSLQHLLGCLCCCVICACTAARDSAPPLGTQLKQVTGQNGRVCIRSHRIRGWSSLGHGVIAIDAGRHYYLATMMPGCLSLSTSAAAMFADDFGELCGGGLDEIKLAQETCRIRELFEFADRSAAQAVFTTVIEKPAAGEE